MFPGGAEFVPYERHKSLLEQAERARLVKLIRDQPPQAQIKFRTVIYWLGGQLITWGIRLQKSSMVSSPQIATTGHPNGG